MTSSQTVAAATTQQPAAPPPHALPGDVPSGEPPTSTPAPPPETDNHAAPDHEALTASERRRRVIGASVWAGLFVIGWLTIGIPTDPVEAFVWIWLAVIAWNNFRPWRTHLVFVRDWAAVVVLLVVYNISRGWADNGVPHATAMIHADEHMWGWLTGGVVPTIWLQQHLYDPAHIHWYDVLASFTYFSHFVVALTVAAVLWVRNRARWASFVRRWFTLTALGLATYFIFPAAPPWWAAQHGLIGPVARLSARGWDALGLHHAGSVLNAAQVQSANEVAAMPSLHSAYAMLVVAFFLPTVRKRWWPLLLAYPLAMTFSLVYSGEHYVIDVFVGWAYVAFTYLLVGTLEWLWKRYRTSKDANSGALERDDLPQEVSGAQKV